MNAIEDGEENTGEGCSEPSRESFKAVSPKKSEESEDGIECEPCGEGVSARIAKLESLPSKEEVETHNASHVPYRSWCPHCVNGKGKAGFHMKQDASQHTVPTISMDYFYFVKPEEGVERGPPSIVLVDDKSGMLKSSVLKQKGVEEWSIKVVKKYVESLGYKKVVMKNDNENAIMALRDEVKKHLQVEVIPEQPPKYDSRTSGRAEHAVQRIEGQFRTLRSALETIIGEKMEAGHPIVEWMVSHAGDTLNRYHIGSDGRTSYQRWKGKAFKKVVPELGERIQYLRSDSLKEVRRDKGYSRWGEGHFLGVRNETGELLIGSEGGVVSARDFHRIADPSRRWNAESLKQIQGKPWQPNPLIQDGEVHPNLRIPESSGPIPEFKGVEEEPVVRRMRITPKLAKQAGLSVNCTGCRAIRDGNPPANHNE